MNTQRIQPKPKVEGKIAVPSSKSYAQRAIALAGLNKNSTRIKHLTSSSDVIAAKAVIEELGAKFVSSENEIILSKGIDFNQNNELSINCHESGLSTRLFSAFSLLFPQNFQVYGSGSIQQRTMEMVISGLEEFGKKVSSKNSKLPLDISGEIQNQTVEIDGSISSQFLTGLLITSPFLVQDTHIKVHNLKSIPYVDMTIELMESFGLKVAHNNYENFYIKGNQSIANQIEYTVEGDWSAASFHIVAAAIGGKMELTGLMQNSLQGDRAILDAVKTAGANVFWKEDRLNIEQNEILPFTFDATECPDLFPPLVVLAAFANGKSTMKGVRRLEHKESNRGITLQKELAKVGVVIDLNDDEMIIHGKGRPEIQEELVFSSYNDHRIAMAMSLFSIGNKNDLYIENPLAIEKSYPDFYNDFLTI